MIASVAALPDAAIAATRRPTRCFRSGALIGKLVRPVAGPFAPGIFFEAPPILIAAAHDRSPHARAIRILFAAFAFALGAAHALAQSAVTSVPGLRLPRDVVPLAYDAKLRIDPAVDTFSGTIEITIRVLEPTDLVWLNAKKLAIREARGVVVAAPDEEIAASTVPGSDDVVGLQFAKVLPAGEVRVTIGYCGAIESVGGVGLFRQQDGGRWYALTQFEPTDARRVFPCFDEPDRKATWKLTLTIPAAARAFANMPIEAERAEQQGWREVSFQRTPLLPSYLIAFAVGDFDVRDGGRAGLNKTPIAIVTPKGRAAEAAYAAANTGAILAATEKYFGRPYPFPKLDLLAYPKSTFGGAMENAGLITFTARALLAREDELSPIFEQRFTGYAAHEIAHMWFGDYVTMAWWNDLWLNESFASWMGTRTTAELRPDWPLGGWRSHERSRAMEFDRLASARRMRQPVTENADMRAAFDGITYAKGETVIAMFEQWLGPDKFREGVRRYIERNAWGNATAEDFFAALAATDPALVSAFRGFVERAGVPLLDVALDCTGTPSVRLVQQRFVPVGQSPEAVAPWIFPACFDYGDATRGRQVCALVSERKQVVPLPAAVCPQWVVANRSGSGYYLPRLAPALYAALPKAERVLAPTDYEPLLGDLEMLARGGAVGFQDVLPVAARQAANPDPRAASRAYDLAKAVPEDMIDPGNNVNYAAWLRHHFGDRARALAWLARKGESPDLLRLREIAVPLVSDRGGDTALARKAQQLAQRWLAHRSAIPPESRRMVLAAAARAAGKDAPRLFDALLAIATNGQDANERDDILVALASFRDPVLARRALDLTLGPVGGREAEEILATEFEYPGTRRVALVWLAANMEPLAARVPHEQQGYWPLWADAICSAGEREQFVALFERRAADLDAGPRKYRQALEKIDLCLALRRAQQAPLNAFLATAR